MHFACNAPSVEALVIFLNTCEALYGEPIKSFQSVVLNEAGQPHSYDDRPAMLRIANDAQWWCHNGQPHREDDKPAVVWADGTQLWFRDGKLHRENDNPAAVYADGTKAWLYNGQLHRDGDQPAIIRADGTQEWWRNGVQYTPSRASGPKVPSSPKP